MQIFFCYANFSIVLDQISWGGKSLGGELPQGVPPAPPVEENQNRKCTRAPCIMCVQYIGGCSVHRGFQ